MGHTNIQAQVQGRTKEAQVYPQQLCRAISRGPMEQMSQQEMEVQVLCRMSHVGRDWMAKNDIDVRTLASIEARKKKITRGGYNSPGMISLERSSTRKGC